MQNNNPQVLRAELANLSPGDAQFIRGLIELFADPRNEPVARVVRKGEMAMQYDPKDGKPRFVDIQAEAPGFGRN